MDVKKNTKDSKLNIPFFQETLCIMNALRGRGIANYNKIWLQFGKEVQSKPCHKSEEDMQNIKLGKMNSNELSLYT